MFNSVELLPNAQAAALFYSPVQLYQETNDISPIVLSDRLSVMPWGADNSMPYDVLDRIQADETMTTCQAFNAEICYGSGLEYRVDGADEREIEAVKHFFQSNDMPSVWFGQCQDLKHFGFSVVVVILNADGNRIVALHRKEACNCRFTVANKHGRIAGIVYADWRKTNTPDNYEYIPLLSFASPLTDLQQRMQNGNRERKFAIVSRIPTVDSTYYPIPNYGSLFRSKWYDIKQLIATAKFAKLRNSAPLKYQIEISQHYWENLFMAEGITDLLEKKERVKKEKEKIVNFLTGAENSGKALFSTFYVTPNGEEQHEVQIKRIEANKEGGDWESDIQEAINIMCFTMGVHSNLVGSVPGKAQTNNSGSDKRELYTIAQARQKPYHALLFKPHRLICAFNEWQHTEPVCPFLMLTTLDQHTDAMEVEC